MQLSNNGVKFICEFEGLFTEAYKDQAGIWTIGYGTIKYPDGSLVKKGDKCSREDAERWLSFEIGEKTAQFNRVLQELNLQLKQNQFDALTSFFYNVGIGKSQKGTSMGDAINSKNKKAIANAFLLYNKYTSVFGIKLVSKGLDRRRKAEKALFEGKDAAGNI